MDTVSAISLLEEDPKKSNVKKYITAFLILFITFAIPVTITQFYQSNEITSSAYVPPSSRTLQSYTNSGISVAKPTTPSILSYWWLAPIAIVLVGVWIYLVVIFIKEKNSQYES